MATTTRIKLGYYVLFGFIVLFSFIELSISAWLIARYNANHNFRNPSQLHRVRFILFCSCWTIILSTLYLVGFLLAPTGSLLTGVGSHLIFLFFTWALWTGAAASITESLGGGLGCKFQNVFVYCGQLNALEGFSWLIWILITIAFFIVIYRAISSARKGDGLTSGIVAP